MQPLWQTMNVSTKRVVLGVILGPLAIVWIGRWSGSVVTGDLYAAALLLFCLWPLIPFGIVGNQWPQRLWARSLGLYLASVLMGRAATEFLGFNPQANVLSHWSWSLARALLWQFPIAIPVENLLLVVFVVGCRKLFGPSRMAASVFPALAFGLLHVPFWGAWAWFSVGASVLPWTIYMVFSGDLWAPVIAHLVLDMTAVFALVPLLLKSPYGPWLAAIGLWGLAGLAMAVLRQFGRSRRAYPPWA